MILQWARCSLKYEFWNVTRFAQGAKRPSERQNDNMWPGCASKNAYHINIQSHWDAYIYLYWQPQFFISNQKIFNLLYNAVLLYGGTSLCHMVFIKHIEVSKISCLQWHVSSFELNMQLRDILHHFKPTAEAAASTSVFVHLILGQNTYKCFTTLGALPKHFFGFDVLSRSGQPQLSNLTTKKVE